MFLAGNGNERTTDTSDRYAAPKRVPVQARVMRYDDGITVWTTHDLSEGGAYVCCHRPLPVGSIVEVGLWLPCGADALEVVSSARVAWQNVPDDCVKHSLPPGMGLEFVDLPSAERSQLRQIVHQLSLPLSSEAGEESGMASTAWQQATPEQVDTPSMPDGGIRQRAYSVAAVPESRSSVNETSTAATRGEQTFVDVDVSGLLIATDAVASESIASDAKDVHVAQHRAPSPVGVQRASRHRRGQNLPRERAPRSGIPKVLRAPSGSSRPSGSSGSSRPSGSLRPPRPASATSSTKPASAPSQPVPTKSTNALSQPVPTKSTNAPSQPAPLPVEPVVTHASHVLRSLSGGHPAPASPLPTHAPTPPVFADPPQAWTARPFSAHGNPVAPPSYGGHDAAGRLSVPAPVRPAGCDVVSETARQGRFAGNGPPAGSGAAKTETVLMGVVHSDQNTVDRKARARQVDPPWTVDGDDPISDGAAQDDRDPEWTVGSEERESEGRGSDEHGHSSTVCQAEPVWAEQWDTDELDARELGVEVLETEAMEAGALHARELGVEVLGSEALETDELDAKELGVEVLESEALETDELDAREVGVEVLETEIMEAGDLAASEWDSEVLDSEVLDSEVLDSEVLDSEESSSMAHPARVLGVTLGEIVAEGTTGAVYRAIHDELGAKGVVRLICGPSAPTERYEHFERTADQLKNIVAPGIGKVEATERDGDRLWCLLPTVNGVTLAQRLRTRGPLPWHLARQVIRQLCHTLEAMHQAGIPHGDLNPDLVLLEESGPWCQVCLLDAGVRSALGPSGWQPHYALPEAVTMARARADADIYALGALVHEMLTGRRPSKHTNYMKTMEADVRAGVMACLVSVAAERPASPLEAWSLIDNELALDPTAPVAPKSPMRVQAERFTRRVSPLTAVVLAASAAGVLGMVTAWAMWPSSHGADASSVAAVGASDKASTLPSAPDGSEGVEGAENAEGTAVFGASAAFEPAGDEDLPEFPDEDAYLHVPAEGSGGGREKPASESPPVRARQESKTVEKRTIESPPKKSLPKRSRTASASGARVAAGGGGSGGGEEVDDAGSLFDRFED